MDVNKNSYTFVFAAILVVVIAALLSFAATSLKPLQDKNVALEKKQSILRAIKVNVERDAAGEAFDQYIKKQIVVKNGKEEQGVNAFTIDLAKQIVKPAEERDAPLFVAEKEGKTYYIIPLRGKGLWGPIWGYISLESDINTVYGTTFDHKGETPGLGAEIATPMFSEEFQEKKIMNAQNEFVSIKVKKGAASGDYEVSGISGATITSHGVENMLKDCIQAYIPFLKQYNPKATASTISENVESKELATLGK